MPAAGGDDPDNHGMQGMATDRFDDVPAGLYVERAPKLMHGSDEPPCLGTVSIACHCVSRRGEIRSVSWPRGVQRTSPLLVLLVLRLGTRPKVPRWWRSCTSSSRK